MNMKIWGVIHSLQGWQSKQVQGYGVEDMSNPISNAWNGMNARTFKSGTMTAAYQLRTQTYPVAEATARGQAIPTPVCRRCKRTYERLGHVLGQCRFLKKNRIRRHNLIQGQLSKKLQRSGRWQILEEPRYRVRGANLRPDLVVHSDQTSFVIDVTVRMEGRNDEGISSLDAAVLEKQQKYRRVAKMISKNSGKACEVLGFAVGSRGGMTQASLDTLGRLGFTKRAAKILMKRCCTTALRTSIKMLSVFMDD